MKKVILVTLLFVAIGMQAQEKPFSFICAGSGGNAVYIIDHNGEIEWEYPTGGECNDVWMLRNGNIIFSFKNGCKEVTRDKEVVWTFNAPEKTEIQTVSPLRNGYLTAINGTPAKILELDCDGKVVKSIEINTGVSKPHAQFRQVRKTPQGTYLFGLMGTKEVREVNDKGEVLRKISGTGFSVQQLKNGNLLIGCADDHKIKEIAPDNSVVWEISGNELTGNPLRTVTELQRLSNGNTLVSNWGGHGGYSGKQPQLFIVTPDKKVVWQYDNYDLVGNLSTVQHLDVKLRMKNGVYFK